MTTETLTAEERDELVRSSRFVNRKLLRLYDDALARAEAAEKNYRWMVERAADQNLDGYRELGAKAAAAESRLAAVESVCDRLRCASGGVRASFIVEKLTEALSVSTPAPEFPAMLQCGYCDGMLLARDKDEHRKECPASAAEGEPVLVQIARKVKPWREKVRALESRIAELETERAEFALRMTDRIAELETELSNARVSAFNWQSGAESLKDAVDAERTRIAQAVAELQQASEHKAVVIARALELLRGDRT